MAHDIQSHCDENPAVSRREVLLSMTAGAVAITVGGALSRAGAQTTQPIAALAPTAGDSALHPVTPTVQAFPLADVRVLDGPFLDAQQRDAKYLLSLEPDRMLHNFRVNAGLDPKAPVYAGWDRGRH